MRTVYSLLDESTRKWWYHAKLREWGQDKEARQRERASIRSSVKHLRETIENGGYCSVLNGRWILNIGRYHTLSGYGDITDAIPQCCLILNIPIKDHYDFDYWDK